MIASVYLVLGKLEMSSIRIWGKSTLIKTIGIRKIVLNGKI